GIAAGVFFQAARPVPDTAAGADVNARLAGRPKVDSSCGMGLAAKRRARPPDLPRMEPCMTDRLPAEGRDAYRHFTPISTRWMDNDVYGHVNNVVYYSWFDTAVNGLLIAEGIAGADSPEAIGLVVGTQCQYHEPVSFPTPV